MSSIAQVVKHKSQSKKKREKRLSKKEVKRKREIGLKRNLHGIVSLLRGRSLKKHARGHFVGIRDSPLAHALGDISDFGVVTDEGPLFDVVDIVIVVWRCLCSWRRREGG